MYHRVGEAGQEEESLSPAAVGYEVPGDGGGVEETRQLIVCGHSMGI